MVDVKGVSAGDLHKIQAASSASQPTDWEAFKAARRMPDVGGGTACSFRTKLPLGTGATRMAKNADSVATPPAKQSKLIAFFSVRCPLGRFLT